MRRCRECILPESFPLIAFDDHGICNYCLNYKKIEPKGEKELEQLLAQFRHKGKKADCIVTISGGRDSAFVLHQMVKKYNMRVIALSVDVGFQTQEGIRNLKRMTEILNVEHLILKHDIKTADENRRKNFHAWLKRPSVAMIPIFMMADKTMYLKVDRYARENEIPLVVHGSTEIEKTQFKSGFLGVLPTDLINISLSALNTIKLLKQYFLEYLKNPHYFHLSCLIENVKGFVAFFYDSSFYKDIKTLNFFDYIYWNEREIISTIYNKLDWKNAPDCTTTWRIDDKYSPLYNYLYLKMVGFTENDAMYSNMIREGMISRDEALKRCNSDNIPRIQSLNNILDEFGVSLEDLDKILEEKI